jgi:hypothetical protein
LGTTTIWAFVSRGSDKGIGWTCVCQVDGHVQQDDDGHARHHGQRVLAARAADLAHDVVDLLVAGEAEDDGKEGLGVAVGVGRGVAEGLAGAGVVGKDVVGGGQAAGGDDDGDDEDEEEDHHLDDGEEVVEPDAAAAGKGVDQAGQGGRGEGDAADEPGAGVLDVGGAQDAAAKGDAVAGHVAEGDEGDGEEAGGEQDRVAARAAVDVLQVVEVAAGARDGLLAAAADGVAGEGEAVLHVDVGAGEAVERAEEPEEEGGAGGAGALHDALGGVEDAGAWGGSAGFIGGICMSGGGGRGQRA